MRPYLARIPTYVITEPIPAFKGLAALLEDQRPKPSARRWRRPKRK